MQRFEAREAFRTTLAARDAGNLFLAVVFGDVVRLDQDPRDGGEMDHRVGRMRRVVGLVLPVTFADRSRGGHALAEQRSQPPDEIVDRCVRAMYLKARDLQARGIVASKEEGDLAFVYALGFAMYLGGPFFGFIFACQIAFYTMATTAIWLGSDLSSRISEDEGRAHWRRRVDRRRSGRHASTPRGWRWRRHRDRG